MLREYEVATRNQIRRHDRQQDKARASKGAGTTSRSIQWFAGFETVRASPKN